MRDRPSRWPASRQLWVLIMSLALFETVLTVAASTLGDGPGVTRGQDFMAFYSAGQLAADGRAALMYDLQTIRAVQHEIAMDAALAEQHPFAPWLNPPQAALLFIPFAKAAGLRAALAIWTLLGLACLATSAWICSRFVGEVSGRRWHTWMCYALVLVAPSTLLALGHGQNTPLSLLLLTLAVAAWRADRPVLAGIACAVLAYKPHLAALVALGCWATMGRRVLLGLAIGGATLGLATLIFLPGAIEAFLAKVPGNTQEIFFDREFKWQRHATIVGFLRHLLHSNGPGATQPWVLAITAALVGAVAVVVFRVGWRLRPLVRAGDEVARDRLIACLILATPLLAPYFVDYDLTLLCVAAVLIGRDVLARGDADATRGLRVAGMVAYAWLMMNALVADLTGVNLTTPLLATVFVLHARRCLAHEDVGEVRMLAPDRAGDRLAA